MLGGLSSTPFKNSNWWQLGGSFCPKIKTYIDKLFHENLNGHRSGVVSSVDFWSLAIRRLHEIVYVRVTPIPEAHGTPFARACIVIGCNNCLIAADHWLSPIGFHHCRTTTWNLLIMRAHLSQKKRAEGKVTQFFTFDFNSPSSLWHEILF